MRIRKRQQVYGLTFGVGAFLLGYLVTAVFFPPSVIENTPTWKVHTWIYLSAHNIEIGALGGPFQRVAIVEQVPRLDVLRAVPPLVLLAGASLVNQSIGRTRRAEYIFKNCFSVLLGYWVVALIAILVSGALPAVSGILQIAIIGVLALYVGSLFVGKLTAGLPIIGVISLGTIVVIGLLVIAGGMAVIGALWPLFAVTVGSVTVASGLNWIARNVPT